MIYIYRRKGSHGARDLANALSEAGPRAFRLRDAGRDPFGRRGDCLICWGDYLAGVRCPSLNNIELRSKFRDALMLTAAEVPTVEVTDIAPVLEGTWLGRSNRHVGGADLLRGTARPDFWVKKEEIIEEYRIHMFREKSIRAGKKVPRGDVAAHPWIRSFDGGWRLAYDGFRSDRAMRSLATRAVAALGLDFGAVDLAKLANGNLIVLEVNRAPGIEGGTVAAYVNAITRWVEEL